jgi:hypothetical protein
MAGPHYQDVRRGIVAPMFKAPSIEAEVGNIEKAYSQLAQEVVNCHNRILVDQITIAGAAGVLTVLLPAPLPDTNYTPLCILDWFAFAFVTAITTTSFTVGFSVAAPLGGGIIRVIVIR